MSINMSQWIEIEAYPSISTVISIDGRHECNMRRIERIFVGNVNGEEIYSIASIVTVIVSVIVIQTNGGMEVGQLISGRIASDTLHVGGTSR